MTDPTRQRIERDNGAGKVLGAILHGRRAQPDNDRSTKRTTLAAGLITVLLAVIGILGKAVLAIPEDIRKAAADGRSSNVPPACVCTCPICPPPVIFPERAPTKSP